MTKGVGGRFTHFYPGTLHALDLECPKGTPVLSLASGIVKEVRQSNAAGGIHTRGLFDWNSVGVWRTRPLRYFAFCDVERRPIRRFIRSHCWDSVGFLNVRTLSVRKLTNHIAVSLNSMFVTHGCVEYEQCTVEVIILQANLD